MYQEPLLCIFLPSSSTLGILFLGDNPKYGSMNSHKDIHRGITDCTEYVETLNGPTLCCAYKISVPCGAIGA